MQNFPAVVYVRLDGEDEGKKSDLKASIFQSELMKTGKKIKVGSYRLMNVVDVAGKPELKKSDTKKGAKEKPKKEDK